LSGRKKFFERVLDDKKSGGKMTPSQLIDPKIAKRLNQTIFDNLVAMYMWVVDF